MRVGVVIPAAGKGTRIGQGRPKQFIDLEGKPLLFHVLEYFQSTSLIDLMILVGPADDLISMREEVARNNLTKVLDVVAGGVQRQDSVWNGLQRIGDEHVDYVVVHDAVRPFIDDELVTNVLRSAMEFGAAVPAVHPKETIKHATHELFVGSTPPRIHLWITQTPQIFEFSLLHRAYKSATANGYKGTDDASLVERLGQRVKIVHGSYDNIKITTPEDFELAKIIHRRRNPSRRAH